jgi:glycosyltransferase involved in cell wall biosynthesis
VRRCLLVFEPPDGGVAENVLRLALGLREHGWETWAAGPREALVYPQLRAAGVPVTPVSFKRGYGHPWRDAMALRELRAILRSQPFDLVHCHSAKAGVLGRIAARRAAVPVVYSPHCFPFVGPWGWPRRTFSTAVERRLGPRTDAILCVAEDERRLALEKGLAPSERLHVVHNGSRRCEHAEPEPRLEELRAEGPLAACIAVLRPQKAVNVFVEAAPLILERVPSARLAVVGNGEMRAELEGRAAELGLAQSGSGGLLFLDFAPPAERALRAIDVFVLPSAWEAFPIAVLEAMACGVPQVASDVGGTSEAVSDGETGLLCPPNDPEALAERVSRLLADPDRRRAMGEASRRRHEERFRLELMVERTAALYDSVTGATAATGPRVSSRRPHGAA